MQSINTLNPNQAYKQKKIRIAGMGIVLALLSAMTVSPQGNALAWANGLMDIPAEATAMVLIVLTLATLAISDFISGVWLLIYNVINGRGIKEYFRLGKTKMAGQLMLAALFAGPMATGALMTGINLCGLTYALVIASATPILTAIVGRIVFKETLNTRMIIGIVIAVAGIITLGYAPPSGDYPHFYLGLFIAALAPIGFTLEGIIATYATDMTDPKVAVSLCRSFGSSILNLAIILPLFSALSGDITMGFSMVGDAITNPVVLAIIAFAALSGGFSYLTTYIAFNLSGPTRTLAVVNTFGVWSIPVGFIFAAFGVMEYGITGQAIIGAFVVLAGVTLVVANPKDLAQLREV
jgi:drug/metabolite transporter (DMT)-like permease